MDFASWLQNRKPAPEVVAVIEVAGHLLGVHDATNNFRYRVSEGSNYEAALKFLAEDPERCYQLLQEMDEESVSNSVGAICLSKLAENSFDGDILFEKGGDEIRLLGEHCVNILLKLDQNTGFKRRPVLKQHTVGVLVDGSRASYLAMNLAARLRGYGRLVVLHAHDPAAAHHHHRAPAEMELQKSETQGEEEDEEDFVQRMMQQISDCIEEAQAPGETITIEKFKTKTIAEHICEAVEKHSVDFLMVKHGGSQTVSMECARAARCPVVLLKPEARHPYDDDGVDGSEGPVVG